MRTPGRKNKWSDRVTLQLTAGPASATGVAIASGQISASRLPSGTVTWKAAPDARWGNRCMDVAAPDGRRWLFLALSWEEDNAHPNIDMVIDASDAGRTAVGFLDTQDGTFHEAQLILRPGQGGAAAETGQ